MSVQKHDVQVHNNMKNTKRFSCPNNFHFVNNSSQNHRQFCVKSIDL